ncbi:twin-arginine translocase TatA/TatE family subunit [Arcobacter cryaerophilus gv. occultus]|uniref:twin-arginine translocase TatA/TatE family subunit n=1 Tax=Aliarcobacter cryaerophilus TaxID=28198 RepID=UPI000D01721C|nr:twin-arginine translocase TatA/TatE family subunit [Aliarcobacter cryaerophilus]MBP6289050.1 twin-arginine translocase TatA/TatE family subunit [Aliarcobacter sp.]MBP7251732.1 twin-arginine translocase TatA/TatE family subunit [Aliarcobacter sp.]PRM93033.1 twin-arginine translocase TatA/TatE family subunit [Arcobacter cryaerophilus gv. occultus]
MHMPSGMQLLVIVLIVLILFGGKKIPELAKGLGSGIKNFKKAVKEDDNEEVATASKIDENEKKTDTKSTSSTEPKQA